MVWNFRDSILMIGELENVVWCSLHVDTVKCFYCPSEGASVVHSADRLF